MSYVNQPTSARQTTAISGVVVIHAAIGVALVTGLATNFVPQKDDGPLIVENFKLPPPPPVEKPKPRDETLPAPQPELYAPTPPIILPAPQPVPSTTNILPPPPSCPGTRSGSGSGAPAASVILPDASPVACIRCGRRGSA